MAHLQHGENHNYDNYGNSDEETHDSKVEKKPECEEELHLVHAPGN
jgi:hypothetical protein